MLGRFRPARTIRISMKCGGGQGPACHPNFGLSQIELLVWREFSQIKKLDLETKYLKGIIFDLGYSTIQINDPKKGLSFKNKSKLNVFNKDFLAIKI